MEPSTDMAKNHNVSAPFTLKYSKLAIILVSPPLTVTLPGNAGIPKLSELPTAITPTPLDGVLPENSPFVPKFPTADTTVTPFLVRREPKTAMGSELQ